MQHVNEFCNQACINDVYNLFFQETSIKARSDYPDYDDLSSFFDFEIGPPQITYKEAEDTSSKSSLVARPNSNKKYYYYHSDNQGSHEKLHYSSPAKKQVVTPGTKYTPTEKTFVEGEVKSNESSAILSQARIGKYQVSVVDGNSPMLADLGLSPEYLRRLSGYEKRTMNGSMVASDSTQSATYAENPHPNYQHSGYQHPNSGNPPSYQPSYDPSRHPPHSSNYGDRQQKPSERYNPSNGYSGYNQASASHHPPPQGSYDAKSYRAVQNGYPQVSNSYAPPYYNPHESHNAHNNAPPPPPAVPYNNNPHQVSYNSNPSSYSNPSHPSYNNPSHPSSYSSPSSSSPSSYSPQRSSGEPWRQVTQHHVDWDDKQNKKESWQNGPYPPHPPPLPYSSTSSSTGSYYPKPTYGGSGDKTGHRGVASYVKPESASKPTYSSAASSSDYNPHKPYYSSSTYSSSSKVPSRAGSVSIASSNHHDHHHASSKPGITIRFKAKSPSHHSGGHGVSIPLGFNPLEVVKKLLPSLNPLNNKKVTIGITIENKKDHHTEFHPY